jgi:methylase of polypeptide subunit release factors
VVQALLEPAGIERLRTALTAAGYTSAGVAERLGPAATEAARRGDLRAALRATESRDPLDTLIRLYICGVTEPEVAVAAALPLEDVRAAGLVEPDRDGYRAGVELEPYGDVWLLSDLSSQLRPGRPLRPDHVLGVGAASTTLIDATIRRPVETALDLGTGCGVQALHLSQHAAHVTATDVSARALSFAATTAALAGLDWELLRGDLTRPLAGRAFDTVVSNPPFVVGPEQTTLAYRDSGRPGDAVCAELIGAAPALLNPGGTMQFLANWLHVAGQQWEDRIANWLTDTGLDAWVIQREVSDPVSYVDLWLADAGEDVGRRGAWLDWFEQHKVVGIGLGLVTLRAGGHDDPTIRIEELRQQVDRPLGPHVAAWFERQDWLRAHPAPALLAARFTTVDGLFLRQEAVRAAEGWAVERQAIGLPDGLRWVEEIDPVALALLGGCDGRLTLQDQLELLAMAHEVPVADLAEVAGPLVAHLVERGFLRPTGA